MESNIPTLRDLEVNLLNESIDEIKSLTMASDIQELILATLVARLEVA